MNSIISFSVRVYGQVMRLYPASHRDAVGEEELQVLKTLCQETYREKGVPGLLRVWLKAGPDLVHGVLAERAIASVTPNPNEPPLTPAEFIRYSLIEFVTILLIPGLMVVVPGTPLYFEDVSEITNLHRIGLLITLCGQIYTIRMIPRITRRARQLEQLEDKE